MTINRDAEENIRKSVKKIEERLEFYEKNAKRAALEAVSGGDPGGGSGSTPALGQCCLAPAISRKLI